MSTIAAALNVSALKRRPTAANVMDRAPVTMQNIVSVDAQVLRSIPLENVDDAPHCAKATA